VSLEFNGEIVEATDEESLIEIGFNGGVLQFPVTVTINSDGEEQVIESIEALYELLEEC